MDTDDTRAMPAAPDGMDPERVPPDAPTRAARPLTSNPLRRAAKRLARTAVDAGLVGQRLRHHVVVCGFPRAGTTLLEQVVAACVQNCWTWPEEVPAVFAAADAHRTTPYMCTKDPRDVHRVEQVREHYADGPAGPPRFVLVVRDPRDVLTSQHAGYPPARGYYCEPERWRRVWHDVQAHRDDPDVLVVRYEDLVTTPDRVQAALTEHVGWSVGHPFARYHEVVAGRRLDAMTKGALGGGVRPLDTAGIGRWRDPEHRERLAACHAALPELDEGIALLGADAHGDTRTAP